MADYYLLSKQDVATVKAALAFQKNIRGPGVRRTPDGLTIDPPTNGGGISPPDAQPAWLIVRDHASNTTVVAGNKMYYEAKLVTDDTLSLTTFMNGTDAFDCIAWDPEQTNLVSGSIIVCTTAAGTDRTGLPLHGAQLQGVPAGSVESGGKSYPVYKITPQVRRHKFHGASPHFLVSYTINPGILDNSGDPVGDSTTLDNDQDRLWVRSGEAGPCASGTV